MADTKTTSNVVSDKAKAFSMDALKNTLGAKPKGLNIPSTGQKPKSIAAIQTPRKKPDTPKVMVVKRPSRKRTGRNYKFNQTVTPQTAQAFYDMQEKLDIPMGAVLELAIDALKSSQK